jgi:hypothetical protein
VRVILTAAVKSRVGADGVLRVPVAIGEADADCEVQLTIEPLSPATISHQIVLDFLKATVGAWQGEFEHPEHWDYEEQEPFPGSSPSCWHPAV